MTEIDGGASSPDCAGVFRDEQPIDRWRDWNQLHDLAPGGGVWPHGLPPELTPELVKLLGPVPRAWCDECDGPDCYGEDHTTARSHPYIHLRHAYAQIREGGKTVDEIARALDGEQPYCYEVEVGGDYVPWLIYHGLARLVSPPRFDPDGPAHVVRSTEEHTENNSCGQHPSYEGVDVVYVLREGDTNRVKIGVTRKGPATRVASFQTGNSRQIGVLLVIPTMSTGEAYELEGRLHREYAMFRRSGEWFELPGAALDRLMRMKGSYCTDDSDRWWRL
jgi:hypothetical protein